MTAVHDQAKEVKPVKRPVPPAEPVKFASSGKKTEIGKNVFLEIDGDKRRVLVNAVVCLRHGMLEQFLCCNMIKAHESILSAEIDARNLHAALLAAGAEAGSPVKFQPKYTPATGSVIKVFVQYESEGKTITVPARQWVRNIREKKELAHDWVFGGSFFVNDMLNPKGEPFYAANDGDVICLSNFTSAMMDLPILSTDADADLDFEAFTERIPPEETPVTVILEPVVAPKGK